MTQKPKDKADGATGQTADSKSDPMSAAVDRAQQAGGAMVDGSSQVGVKLLDQAEINTQEAFKAMRAAAQASDITEVMRIQAEYLRQQGSRSVSQAREIGDLIASFGRNAIGSVTRRD